MTPHARLLAVLTAGALALGLTACGGDEDTANTTERSTTTVTTDAQLPAPIIHTPDELDGQNITINFERSLIINVPDNPQDWTTGSVDDNTIAQFIPGRADATATFNPGFIARNHGETTAHITNPTTGTTITFTLTISE